MKTIVNTVFIISGIIPATFLLLLCFFMIGKFFTDSYTDSSSTLFLFNSILGVFGYVGLIFLLLEHKVKSWVILCFLASGLCSFVIFNSIAGERAWRWILTMEEPNEWFIFVWPAIVAFVSIVRIMIERIIMKNDS